MKKLILPAIIIAFLSLIFLTTSCNSKVCVKCYKISDSTLTQEFCSSDANDRNDFVVEQTHADYNCVNE